MSVNDEFELFMKNLKSSQSLSLLEVNAVNNCEGYIRADWDRLHTINQLKILELQCYAAPRNIQLKENKTVVSDPKGKTKEEGKK